MRGRSRTPQSARAVTHAPASDAIACCPSDSLLCGVARMASSTMTTNRYLRGRGGWRSGTKKASSRVRPDGAGGRAPRGRRGTLECESCHVSVVPPAQQWSPQQRPAPTTQQGAHGMLHCTAQSPLSSPRTASLGAPRARFPRRYPTNRVLQSAARLKANTDTPLNRPAGPSFVMMRPPTCTQQQQQQWRERRCGTPRGLAAFGAARDSDERSTFLSTTALNTPWRTQSRSR